MKWWDFSSCAPDARNISFLHPGLLRYKGTPPPPRLAFEINVVLAVFPWDQC